MAASRWSLRLSSLFLSCATLLLAACSSRDDGPAQAADEPDAGPSGVPSGVEAERGPHDTATARDSGAPPPRAEAPDAATIAAQRDAAREEDARSPTAPSDDDPQRPWQLDCARLPSGGVCAGGPREVLLATKVDGEVLMFDPRDGHYLGVFKRPSQDESNDDHGYRQATQGPDQCIWTVSGDDNRATTRAIERWNTDGSFRDDILPRGKLQRAGADRLEDARAFAFGPDHVYVAAGNRERAGSHISRYRLDGSFEAEVSEAPADALLRGADGSLLIAGDSLQRLPPDGGPPHNVLTEASTQLWYLGRGEVLTTEASSSDIYRVAIDTGAASHISVVSNIDSIGGIAALGNGRWLYTSAQTKSVWSVDPAAPSAAPTLQFSYAEDPRRFAPTFTQFGRACLPNEVVERERAPTPPVPVERCDDVPAGDEYLRDDFESGAFGGSGKNRSYNGWHESTTFTPLSALDESEHVSGTRSLRVSPKQEQVAASGVVHTFAGIKPSYIGYWVKLDTVDRGAAELLLGGSADLEGIYLNVNGIQTEHTTVEAATGGANGWVRVQLRNIDWSRRSYDLYVDCKRVADDLPLAPEAGDDLRQLDLYVVGTGDNVMPAFFDDIVIK
jgi:hypothetical protein